MLVEPNNWTARNGKIQRDRNLDLRHMSLASCNQVTWLVVGAYWETNTGLHAAGQVAQACLDMICPAYPQV